MVDVFVTPIDCGICKLVATCITHVAATDITHMHTFVQAQLITETHVH